MKSILFPDLRPVRSGDRLDAHNRALLVNRARQMRAGIEQIFALADHWNRSNPTEQPLDADPDGEMRQTADELDALLLREQRHVM